MFFFYPRISLSRDKGSCVRYAITPTFVNRLRKFFCIWKGCTSVVDPFQLTILPIRVTNKEMNPIYIHITHFPLCDYYKTWHKRVIPIKKKQHYSDLKWISWWKLVHYPPSYINIVTPFCYTYPHYCDQPFCVNMGVSESWTFSLINSPEWVKLGIVILLINKY